MFVINSTYCATLFVLNIFNSVIITEAEGMKNTCIGCFVWFLICSCIAGALGSKDSTLVLSLFFGVPTVYIIWAAATGRLKEQTKIPASSPLKPLPPTLNQVTHTTSHMDKKDGTHYQDLMHNRVLGSGLYSTRDEDVLEFKRSITFYPRS